MEKLVIVREIVEIPVEVIIEKIVEIPVVVREVVEIPCEIIV